MDNIDLLLEEIVEQKPDMPIKSLKVQKELNPKLWDANNEHKIFPEVRDKLLQTAQYFINTLNLAEVGMGSIPIVDIVIVGSLVNYNWSPYSDFDVHIIADLTDVPEQYRTLLASYFKQKKDEFEQKHNIKIYGYDVEGYVESMEDSENRQSLGEYSLTRDEWVKFPQRYSGKIDINTIKKKTKSIMMSIDAIERSINFGNIKNPDGIIDELHGLWKRIKEMRRTGLAEGGEFATENLIFKLLRRNGYIGKLLALRGKVIDEKLSLMQNGE